MARHSKRHRHGRNYKRRHSSKSRRMRGGNSSYSSASTYGMYVNGPMNSQWSRTMDQSGTNGNTLIGAQGQNTIPAAHMANNGNMNLIQSGAGSRRKRGGFLGEVVSQAIVPLGLLGLQQSYTRKKHGGKHKRRR